MLTANPVHSSREGVPANNSSSRCEERVGGQQERDGELGMGLGTGDTTKATELQ